MEKLEIVYNKHKGLTMPKTFSTFDLTNAELVNNFHKSFDEYFQTPLASLNNTAKVFGINGLYIKDESFRFGLNAFKGLGGSYCLGKYICDLLNKDIKQSSYADISSNEIKGKIGTVTFVTATDGNHGRGIAWTASKLGQKAVVYMPKGSSVERLENIRKLGAQAEITELNYDDTVRFAQKQADEKGWILVQDTAWPGYEKIPTYIMQGYMTMANEAVQQLGDTKPTHIFLQAGVGAMSGSIAAYLRNIYGLEPKIIIVEPNKADCIFKTALADDGHIHIVKGDMNTIMAGLACGEPCTIGWDLLKYSADAFISMDDSIAAKGMRVLASPEKCDDRVISGESGAATTGAVLELLSKNEYCNIRENLKLNENSIILCFSTEGDTDKENYRKIVWDGFYPSYK